MIEVWYIVILLCANDGVCGTHVPPATYSSEATCGRARLNATTWWFYHNAHEFSAWHKTYCTPLLVEDKRIAGRYRDSVAAWFAGVKQRARAKFE